MFFIVSVNLVVVLANAGVAVAINNADVVAVIASVNVVVVLANARVAVAIANVGVVVFYCQCQSSCCSC